MRFRLRRKKIKIYQARELLVILIVTEFIDFYDENSIEEILDVRRWSLEIFEKYLFGKV